MSKVKILKRGAFFPDLQKCGYDVAQHAALM